MSRQLLLSLQLLRLPPKIKQIEAKITLKLQSFPTFDTKKIIFSYNHYEHIWATESFPTFELLNSNNSNALKIVLAIEVTKIFEDVGRKKGRQIDNKLWENFGFKRLVIPNSSSNIDDGNEINDDRMYSSLHSAANRQVLFLFMFRLFVFCFILIMMFFKHYSKSVGFNEYERNEECKYHNDDIKAKTDALRIRSFTERVCIYLFLCFGFVSFFPLCAIMSTFTCLIFI